MTQLRRTKIVTTLGPATDEDQVLADMLRAGANVVRINLAHGTWRQHAKRIEQVRRVSSQVGRVIGVLADLQGPKIRVERFVQGAAKLAEGESFTLDTMMATTAGDDRSVGVSYKQLPEDVGRGDVLLLGDGQIRLHVDRVDGPRVVCTVQTGGTLADLQGINREGGGLSIGSLTTRDRDDLRAAADAGIDFISVSFVRSAEDIEEARDLTRQHGSDARIVAKIERVDAVHNIESIAGVSDAVMVARGDLGIEMGYAELTGLQKRIIRMTRRKNRVVITATQMMESMIHNPTPTRAEVSDVANAVMDGSDAVMLSAETAIGEYPAKAVEAMAKICVGAEKHLMTHARSRHRVERHFKRTDEAIAMAVMYTANHLKVKAIIALTESGSTALWMSRIRSDIPIYALTRHDTTRRRVTLYRGVYPVDFDVLETNSEAIYQAIFNKLLSLGLVENGDLVIVTKGDRTGVAGHTNAMTIVKVSE